MRCIFIDEFNNMHFAKCKISQRENTLFIKVYKLNTTLFETLIEKDKITLVRYKNKLHILINKNNIILDDKIKLSTDEFSDILDSIITTSVSLLSLNFLRYFIIVLICSIIAAIFSIIGVIK